MESLRTICDRDFSIQQQKIDSFTSSFPSSLNSIKTLAVDTSQNHAKLAKMKANLREAEDKLVKVLAAKTRKEANQMATRDSISAIKARVEELKRTVQFQITRRDEYGAVISRQSLGNHIHLLNGLYLWFMYGSKRDDIYGTGVRYKFYIIELLVMHIVCYFFGMSYVGLGLRILLGRVLISWKVHFIQCDIDEASCISFCGHIAMCTAKSPFLAELAYFPFFLTEVCTCTFVLSVSVLYFSCHVVVSLNLYYLWLARKLCQEVCLSSYFGSPCNFYGPDSNEATPSKGVTRKRIPCA